MLTLGLVFGAATAASTLGTSTVEVLAPQTRTLLTLPLAIEQVARGFEFAEGPLWMPDGELLVSDIPANRVYAIDAGGRTRVFLERSGTGKLAPGAGFIGSNGLALTRDGTLILAQHGARALARLTRQGALETLVDRYMGRRLNSPNDLAVRRADGSLWFTDPPYLFYPELEQHPAVEQRVAGVYRWRNGTLTLMLDELRLPNGIAFSPDEHVLYVGSSDPRRPVVRRYPLAADGHPGTGRDLVALLADGIKVDERGNLWVATPEGIVVVSAAGAPLLRVRLPEEPSNLAFGDGDGRTLYVTARTSVYRLRTRVRSPAPTGH